MRVKKTSDKNIVEMITQKSCHLLGRKVKIDFERLGWDIPGYNYMFLHSFIDNLPILML